MRLQFPSADADKAAAFDNAIAAGAMVRDSGSHKFWARFTYLASDVEDDKLGRGRGKVVADYFYSPLSNVYTRVERKAGSE